MKPEEIVVGGRYEGCDGVVRDVHDVTASNVTWKTPHGFHMESPEKFCEWAIRRVDDAAPKPSAVGLAYEGPKPYEQVAAEKAMAFDALDEIARAVTGKPWHIVGTAGIIHAFARWAWLRRALVALRWPR